VPSELGVTVTSLIQEEVTIDTFALSLLCTGMRRKILDN
jgi:hypothetical protein